MEGKGEGIFWQRHICKGFIFRDYAGIYDLWDIPGNGVGLMKGNSKFVVIGFLMSLLLVAVSVEGAEPAITIIYPQNVTYATTDLNISWQSNEALDWAGYELNGAVNDSSISLANTSDYIGSFISIYSGKWKAIQFNFSNPGTFYTFSLGLMNVSTSSSKPFSVVLINDSSDNLPNGTVIQEINVTIPYHSSQPSWVDVDFTDINFAAGERYWIKMYSLEANSRYGTAAANNPNYPERAVFGDYEAGSTDQGITWSKNFYATKYRMVRLNASIIEPNNISFTAQEGSNTLYIWANDTSGNMNYSKRVFTAYTSPPLLMECPGVINSPKTLTFHMFEEENRTAMNATMEIAIWENSNLSNNYSFKFENTDTYHICIYPSWEEYEVDATIEYYETGYTRRNYFLSNATINNVTSDINLYLLSSAMATNIQFLAKDVYHNLQENVIIKAQRFYTSENEYITVAMGRTGFDGVAGIPLRQNIWYRYILERENAVLRTYNPMYLTESELELYIEQAERIEFFMYWGTVAHSCSYNNDSQNLICTFSDTSGKMVEVKLMAEERRLVGNFVTVCENTTVSTSGTLACSLAAHQNKTINYYLYGRFCCSEETFMVMESGILDLHDAFSYGMIGVLITFILVLTAGMTGIWNPAVSIVLTMVALFASITMQLITVGPAAFMGLVVVAGLIVFKMRS